MSESVELPRIKRKLNSWDGSAISYLLNHPSRMEATKMAQEAISAFYLVEALEGKVDALQFQQACRWAMERLEAKLWSVKRLAGIPATAAEPVATSHTHTAHKQTVQPFEHNNHSVDDDNDDDDDGLIELEWTEELIIANRALGFER